MKPAELYPLARANFRSLGIPRRAQSPDDWTGPFPLPPSLIELYRELGPDGYDVPGYGNPSFIPSLAGLWPYQAGYRWNARTNEPVDWDDDLIMIADHGGDPLVLSRARGIVLHAIHGTGEWRFEEFCADPATLLAVLTTIGVGAEAFGRDRADMVDREMEEYMPALRDQLVPIVGDRAADIIEMLGLPPP